MYSVKGFVFGKIQFGFRILYLLTIILGVALEVNFLESHEDIFPVILSNWKTSIII